jgi:hypothetical protein
MEGGERAKWLPLHVPPHVRDALDDAGARWITADQTADPPRVERTPDGGLA